MTYATICHIQQVNTSKKVGPSTVGSPVHPESRSSRTESVNINKAQARIAQAKPYVGSKLSKTNGNTMPPIEPPVKLSSLMTSFYIAFAFKV